MWSPISMLASVIGIWRPLARTVKSLCGTGRTVRKSMSLTTIIQMSTMSSSSRLSLKAIQLLVRIALSISLRKFKFLYLAPRMAQSESMMRSPSLKNLANLHYLTSKVPPLPEGAAGRRQKLKQSNLKGSALSFSQMTSVLELATRRYTQSM